MDKILKLVEIKRQIRDKEILEADVDSDLDQSEDEFPDLDKKVFGKDRDVEKLDPFFTTEEAENAPQEVEIRPVMRDGRVPKFQKNIEKIRQKEIERQRRAEGWYEEQQKAKEE